uniref:Guanine nucleotide binding protein (G protein), beta polypeptide 1-like n=1 Tax=Callorhinchus milii TaxID=7868 RepID=A0A4W3JHW4_CALMI
MPGTPVPAEIASPMARSPPDPMCVLRGTRAAVNTLHFCCGDQAGSDLALFSGSANGLIHIWNLKTHRADTVLGGHSGQSVLWVQTLQHRETLFSQGRDSAVRVWDLAEGRSAVTDSIPVESYGFCQGSLLEDNAGHYLLALPGKATSEVKIIDVVNKTPVCTLNPAADAKLGMPMCLKLWQLEPCSRPLLLAGYEDGSVTLWDVSEGRMLTRLACQREPVMCLDFDPQKAKGICGSSAKLLSSWTLDRQQSLKSQEVLELVNPGVAQVCLRQDKRILATAGWDQRIRVFSWKKLKALAVLQYHTDSVHCVTFSDHSALSPRLLAAGSKDQLISLWSLYNQM